MKHTDWLDDVRNRAVAASRRHRRTEQIVQSKNVRDVELSCPRPAIPLHRRIPAYLPVRQPGRKVNRLDTVFPTPPAERRSVRSVLLSGSESALFQTPICGKHRHLMPASRQTFGERAHFHGRTPELQKWGVGLGD